MNMQLIIPYRIKLILIMAVLLGLTFSFNSINTAANTCLTLQSPIDIPFSDSIKR
jgi:hypothetical protein